MLQPSYLYLARRSIVATSFHVSLPEPDIPQPTDFAASLDHPHSFPSQLQLSAKSRSLPLGRISHDEACRQGLDQDPYIQSLLVQMYAASGAIDDAMSIFSTFCHLHHQSFIWNHIIRGLTQREHYEDAAQLFIIMRQHGVVSDKFTFISMVTVCSNEGCLNEGKRLHALVHSSGLHRNVVLATALIAMYQKCGSLENAWKTFEEILQPDEVSWTSIISAHVHHNQNEQAFHLYDLMLQEGFGPSKIAFACVVDACTNSEALQGGMLVHACVIEFGVKPDILLENSFLKLYCVHGCMEDARHIFEKMQHRDVVSFNTLISGSAQTGSVTEALHLFSQLFSEGMKPNKPTYISLIEACTNAEVETEGKQLHNCILDAGFDSDAMISTKLVKMYGTFGSLHDAERLFDIMKEHNMTNIVLWTTMISVCSQHGKNLKALCYHQQMLQEGIMANKITFVCLITVLTCLLELIKGKHAHVYILNCGLKSDIIVNNFLISMYGKCSSIEDARRVFDNLSYPDSISWYTMLEIYTQHYQGTEAIKLFTEMKEDDANEPVLVSVVDACTGSKMLIEGKIIHFCAVKDGFETRIEILNALENMYAKCGCLEDACCMFSIATEPNVVTWTTIIGTHVQFGKANEALQMFHKMKHEGKAPNNVTFINLLDACGLEAILETGKQMHVHIIEIGLATDVVVNNALIKMYGKCHGVNGAWILFHGMCQHDADSWTAMITVCVQHGMDQTALELFDIMQHKGFQPSKASFIGILDACNNGGAAIVVVELMHYLIVHYAFDADFVISTALMNLYGKCGTICSAQNVFEKMETNNLLSWTTIVSICAQHGKGKEAFNLCRRMEQEGFTPDEVTLLNLFVACSHSGLVEEGMFLFTSSIKSGIIPLNVEHFVCMIDILGRAGQLNEAEILVQHMPSKPTAVALMSLLGSCRCQGDLERGERAAIDILGLDSEDSATYVMLSNMYAEGELKTMEVGLAI